MRRKARLMARSKKGTTQQQQRDPVDVRKQLLERPAANKAFQPFGAALFAWRSKRRELMLAGAANTGKSRAILEKMHYCADRYPKMRGLIVRKARTSLTQTALVTYEKKVIPDGWLEDGVIRFNTTDQQYEYPNGSIIAVGGLDKSSKVMSSEWDMIYPQEATELTEGDWEDLSSRLRNHMMPYQQIIGDCNPGPPTHWIKVRAMSGRLLMLDSKHEDNPACTPEDIATLDALTGVRYLRLRLGIWAAAEGLVYDEWDPTIHRLSRIQMIERDIFNTDGSLNRDVIRRCIGGIDWGWKNPGVLQVFGLDNDERLYMLCETYKTQQTDDWWVKQAKALSMEYGVERWIADPAEPAYIDKFNNSGLLTFKADNAILPGITSLKSRLHVAGDGRPRFFVYEESLRDRDELRVRASQPFCFEGEVGEYCYAKSKDGTPIREIPVKINDHSMDTARYVAHSLERVMIPLAGGPSNDNITMKSTTSDDGGSVTKSLAGETDNQPTGRTVDPFSWAVEHGLWDV